VAAAFIGCSVALATSSDATRGDRVAGVGWPPQLGTVSSGVIATYQDECFAFVTALTQTGTQDRDVKPGASLVFSLVFKNLGEVSAPAFATQGVQ